MGRACSGQAAREYLAPLGNEPSHQAGVLVIDDVDLFLAELANLSAAEELLLGT